MTPSSGYYNATVAEARAMLAAERLDAALVTDLYNIRRFCGFTGSNGLLLIFDDRAIFFTDSRYTLQAGHETRGVKVRKAADVDLAAARVLKRRGVARVALESGGVTHKRWLRLQKLVGGAELVDVGVRLTVARLVKTAWEVQKLRDASDLAQEALRAVVGQIRPGATELEVARNFHVETLRRGADALSFDTIVAGGPRGALPHAQPGAREFEAGDLVVVDFGVVLEGFCSDQTVTVPVGKVGAEAKEVYELVHKAQKAALDTVRPGVRFCDVDRAARGTIDAAGHARHFGHGTGHGVGLEVHEAPVVGPRSKEMAREGMVFTVEPGVYLPDRFGVRLEDTVVVTAQGWEPVTTLPKAFGALTQL